MFLISKQTIESVPADKPHTFPTAAAEPAYDFRAYVFYRRVDARRRRGTWWLEERDELMRAREHARETVRSITRQFSIFAPGPAELAVNQALSDGGRADRQRMWAARAELAAPEPVREVLRAALREKQEIDAKAAADAKRVESTDRLCRLWGEFLAGAAKNHIAPHALKLVEDPEPVAQVLAEMLSERWTDARDLIGLVTRIVEAHRSAGLLEMAVQSETALRRTLQMMGIELPAQDPDAPLIPTPGE